MWKRLFEFVDDNPTGRWQWFLPAEHNARVNEEVATRCVLTSGERGWCYPGQWMVSTAICAPPGMGGCMSQKQYLQRNQMLASLR